MASLQVGPTLLVLEFEGMWAETADWAGAAVGGGGVHHCLGLIVGCEVQRRSGGENSSSQVPGVQRPQYT
jgi:hypothetical protein